jgi:DNA gyrase subunit A
MSDYTSCSLTSELITDFLSYTVAIYNRALPHVVDGLKVAQRRVLVGMWDLDLRSDGRFVKVSRLDGTVLSRYHPHGSSASTAITMGQESSMRYTLSRVHGNVGGGVQDGPAIGQMVSEDSPAAARYLEIKSTHLAESLYLDQIRAGIGEWEDNYDGTCQEPSFIVPPLPVLLLTGAQGIASGYACHHIPYNMRDVINSTCAWIKNKNITSAQFLSRFTNPPEPPQGGRIVKNEKLMEFLRTGNGQVTSYGEWEKDDKLSWGKRSTRPALVVTRLAYGSSEKFLERVRDLADADKLPGLLDAADYSSRDGIRIVLVTKTVTDRDNLLSVLIHSGTGLKHVYNVNSVAVGMDGKPVTVSARDAVEAWYGERVKYLVELHNHQLRKLRSEQEKYLALEKILNDLDKFLKVVREAKDKTDAVTRVGKGWKLTEAQAKYVISVPISTLIATEKREVTDKLAGLTGQVNDLLPLCVPGPSLDEYICSQITSLRPLAGPSRAVWMTGEVPDAVTVERPLTERERLIEEGDRIGISKREVNRWIKENTGTGKLSDKWEEYKAQHVHRVQMTTRAGKKQRAEELARIRADAEARGLPSRGKYAWNAFMEKNKNVRIDLIRVSIEQWLSQLPKRPHAHTDSSQPVNSTPGNRGGRGGKTAGRKQPTRVARKERRSGKG